jgi:hypothetical protein
MSATQNIFKPGERIALPYLPVAKVENGVAILKKTRFTVGAECGARHRVRIETPFFVRGGFRVQLRKMYKVPGWAYEVVFKTPYGSFVKEHVPQRNVYIDEEPTHEFVEKLIREMFGSKVAEIINVEVKEQPKPVDVYVRRFRHVEVIMPPDDYFFYYRHLGEYHGDTYFVYEFVSPDEAKLVDDLSRIDYVVLAIGHSAESRAGCAEIRIINNDGVVWSDVKRTCCAIRSGAVAMVVSRYGSRITVAMNNLPYRGCCETWTVEEWESVLPPRRVATYETTEPVATSVSPEEVV